MCCVLCVVCCVLLCCVVLCCVLRTSPCIKKEHLSLTLTSLRSPPQASAAALCRCRTSPRSCVSSSSTTMTPAFKNTSDPPRPSSPRSSASSASRASRTCSTVRIQYCHSPVCVCVRLVCVCLVLCCVYSKRRSVAVAAKYRLGIRTIDRILTLCVRRLVRLCVRLCVRAS